MKQVNKPQKKENQTKKLIIYSLLLIVVLAAIGAMIYCLITGSLAKAVGTYKPSEPSEPTIIIDPLDGTAVTLTNADVEGVKDLYINTDKAVYEKLAAKMGGSTGQGFMLIFTDRKITDELSDEEVGNAITIIARFAKSESGYQLVFESIIDNFGTKQDVIVYDTATKQFCTDTSVIIADNGKLTLSTALSDVPTTFYCYLPKTCGCNENDSISIEDIEQIFAITQFEKSEG